MRRLTASQKIAVLERRIAKLEKQALVTEFISDLLNKIKNIPVNLVKRIFNALKDVGSSLELLAGRLYSKKGFVKSLSTQLELRIQDAFYGAYSTHRDLPQISSFDEKDPIRSKFAVRVEGKTQVMNLHEMADHYGGFLGKNIKASFLSWESDFQSFLDLHNGKPSRKLEEKIADNILETIKQGSKLLYRLLKTVLSVFSLKFAFLMVKVSWWDGLNGLVMAKMMGGVEGLNAAASKQFMSSYNTFKKPLIQASVLPVILNLIEKAFIKWEVNTDYFDKRRRAGSYPNIRTAILRLNIQESYAK